MDLKFDYVLTIRYNDSHSDYSMLCSSEMSEWCFFVYRCYHVFFIRRDDGISDLQFTLVYFNSVVVLKCNVFIFFLSC